MEINYEFVKRKVMDDYFLVPTGKASSIFKGIITINELAAYIFDCIPQCESSEEIAIKIIERYNIDYDTALLDVNNFFSALKDAGIVVK